MVDTLQYIAKRYNRPCSLTLEQMEACGATGGALPAGRRGSVSAHASKKFSFNEVWMHLKGLFATKKLGLGTLGFLRSRNLPEEGGVLAEVDGDAVEAGADPDQLAARAERMRPVGSCVFCDGHHTAAARRCDIRPHNQCRQLWRRMPENPSVRTQVLPV